MAKRRSRVGNVEPQIVTFLRNEPCTSAEIARKLKINPKTAQTRMQDMAYDRKIRMKKIGRYRVFWAFKRAGHSLRKDAKNET